MGQLAERLFTKEDLKQVSPTELDSQFKLGEDVWLWYDANTHVEGIIAGVTFQREMVTYDVAIPVQGTTLYLVTYGIRGGMTKPNEAYPGKEGGLVSKTDVPVVELGKTHLH